MRILYFFIVGWTRKEIFNFCWKFDPEFRIQFDGQICDTGVAGNIFIFFKYFGVKKSNV